MSTSEAATDLLPERVLGFTGIHNFRDYGGYRLQDGGRLRSGLLYRSAQHFEASPEDLAKVDGLKLAAVIDLRGDSERRVAPCRRSEGFSARVVFVEAETAGLAPHIEAARSVTDPADALAAMTAGYREMPFRPVLSKALTAYFETLASVDGATLVHCMAGKDRTGLAVALLHAMVGVHRDDMIADYMLTNRAGNIEERIAAGAKVVRKSFGGSLSDDAVRVLMSTHEVYLETAFDSIVERHGSVDAYLRDALGVTSERREAIEARLIA